MKKILVIGCGWSGASFLKDIDTNKYDVTLVSPNTHFILCNSLYYIGDGKSVYQNDYFYGHGKIYGYLNNFIHIYNSINWEQSFIFIKNYIKKD